MFLRWLFLFLVLANLLFLLWHSSFVKEQSAYVGSKEKLLNNIRLLSEMELGALKLKRPVQKAGPDVCHYFEGLANSQEAEWLVSVLRADGFVVETTSETYSDSLYVIKVEISETENTRQLLLEYLRNRRGLGIDSLELDLGTLYVLGRYQERVEAENELQEVVLSGVAAYLVLESIERTQFAVVVYDEIGRKLSSEIKELAVERYSDIKITKKVCEGVASYETTE